MDDMHYSLFMIMAHVYSIPACTDPVALVTGSSLPATEGQMFMEFERIMQEYERLIQLPKDKQDSAAVEKISKSKKTFKFFLLMNRISNDVVRLDAEDKRVWDIHDIETELKQIRRMVSVPGQNCLQFVDWEPESATVYSSGARAPPWRVSQGDLAYILIITHDVGRLHITATRTGYHLNGGHHVDLHGVEKINYDRASDSFKSLVELLQFKSHHFQQHFTVDILLAAEKEDDDHHDKKQLTINTGRGMDTPENMSPTSPARPGLSPGKKSHASAAKSGHSPNVISTPNRPVREFPTPVQVSDIHFKPKKVAPPTVASDAANGTPRDKKIKAPKKPANEDTDSDNLSDDERVRDRVLQPSEYPPDYWQIQKLIKFLKGGNQTAMAIAMSALKEFDLSNELNQLVLRDVGGLEPLVSALEIEDTKLRQGSIGILRLVSNHASIQRTLSNLKIIGPLISSLKEENPEFLAITLETLANCCKIAPSRRTFRKRGGITTLIRLMQSPNLGIARGAARCMSSCSRSDKCRVEFVQNGGIPILAKLLAQSDTDMLSYVAVVIEDCARIPEYRNAIRGAGCVELIVKLLGSTNTGLLVQISRAIAVCSEDSESQKIIRANGGVPSLVNLVKSTNPNILEGATAAMWKCAGDVDNVKEFNRFSIIPQLLELLKMDNEQIKFNVAGAIWNFAKLAPESRFIIADNSGVKHLIGLLSSTNPFMLVNAARAIGACALDPRNLTMIHKMGGIRLLWSLLKSDSPTVQASAAWALCPCIENATTAAPIIRSFVGGLQLILDLLTCGYDEVLSGVCAAVANIAKDEENLLVMTDHGVINLLGDLILTPNDDLRKHLAEAIGCCCKLAVNRETFGRRGAIAPLVNYLRSADAEVHRCTARALFALSENAQNCLDMKEAGAVPLLIAMVGSDDEVLQEAAAGTITNIRKAVTALRKL
eukprot:TRINITY_DN2136_c0_g1_i5.p1 TRINITY_DN2136_c0_g1~~TRINITY_DN2136_c0_g1_i5.p1  ORF type:complete len:941 (+),score=213.11 TRINITY_DN2136_c0_g1_i5:629-3451(+)